MAEERRAEHRVAEGPSRVPVSQPASGKSGNNFLLNAEKFILNSLDEDGGGC